MEGNGNLPSNQSYSRISSVPSSRNLGWVLHKISVAIQYHIQSGLYLYAVGRPCALQRYWLGKREAVPGDSKLVWTIRTVGLQCTQEKPDEAPVDTGDMWHNSPFRRHVDRGSTPIEL
jgi:hypothetical protein